MSKAAAQKARAQVVRLLIPAGKAAPSPPVGPALGARGVKSMDFCKEFNARTAHIEPGVPTPTLITVQPDRTFSFVTKTPPCSYFLKRAASLEKGTTKDEHMKHLPLESSYLDPIQRPCFKGPLVAERYPRVARLVIHIVNP
ncbi:hypothetical protein APHAL10511_001984 [Amanita phalloides]|nr:hypothetical protein APHAL10511_001984 [Amanita phalloides]